MGARKRERDIFCGWKERKGGREVMREGGKERWKEGQERRRTEGGRMEGKNERGRE